MKKSVAVLKKITLACLFLFLALSYPSVKVCANSLVLAPETLTEVQGLFYGLEYSQIAVDGAMSYLITDNSDSSKFGKYKQTGNDFSDFMESVNDLSGVNNISLSDFTVSTLDADSKSDFANMTLYNSNGDVISIDDCTYLTYDNGYFSGSCLIDDTGHLITDSVDSMCNAKFGGKALNQNDVLQKCSDFANHVKNNKMLYAPDGASINVNPTYYCWRYELEGGRQAHCFSIFIQNQYQPGIIEPIPDNGIIYQWYTNDLSLITNKITYGSYSGMDVSTVNRTYNGHYYKYYVSFRSNNQLGNAQIVPYNPGASASAGNYVYAKEGFEYSNSINGTSYSSYHLAKAENIPDKLIDSYSIADTKAYCDSISAVATVANPTFDGNSAITAVNFPISKPFEVALDATTIPFPEVIVNALNPSISFPISTTLTPEVIEDFDEIPILSDLQSKFPFSIPWDIKNMLSLLRARPEPPEIEINFTFPVINYTWNFVIDLTAFDSVATLFRLCFLISFIISLAMFSYDHFFGK